jgi:putative addiction module killer protein
MVRRRTAIYYRDSKTGKEPARDWLTSLKDHKGQARIYTRIERAESGNFGDHRPVGDGVMELRVDVGPGYRVYYALDGTEIILLLLAGNKSSQANDIRVARRFWAAHKSESKGD